MHSGIGAVKPPGTAHSLGHRPGPSGLYTYHQMSPVLIVGHWNSTGAQLVNERYLFAPVAMPQSPQKFAPSHLSMGYGA